MTDEPTPENAGGTVFDDPNREAVGLEPAWVEGTGGTPGEVTPTGESDADTSGGKDQLDQMTKADLLALAKDRGVSPANNDMTKQELIDAIRAAGQA
jgi:hypothetical protein